MGAYPWPRHCPMRKTSEHDQTRRREARQHTITRLRAGIAALPRPSPQAWREAISARPRAVAAARPTRPGGCAAVVVGRHPGAQASSQSPARAVAGASLARRAGLSHRTPLGRLPTKSSRAFSRNRVGDNFSTLPMAACRQGGSRLQAFLGAFPRHARNSACRPCKRQLRSTPSRLPPER